MHGYKEIEMAVFEYIKLITAKHYEHLCMGIHVTQEASEKYTRYTVVS